MDLPRELRDEIYLYALAPPFPNDSEAIQPINLDNPPALFSVSKAIAEDVKQFIFPRCTLQYTFNAFEPDILPCLPHMETHHLLLIRSLDLFRYHIPSYSSEDDRQPSLIKELRAAMPNLRSIALNLRPLWTEIVFHDLYRKEKLTEAARDVAGSVAGIEEVKIRAPICKCRETRYFVWELQKIRDDIKVYEVDYRESGGRDHMIVRAVDTSPFWRAYLLDGSIHAKSKIEKAARRT